MAGGHGTKAPATITHASVVFRVRVKIALMIAALNHLKVKSADITNACVQVPVTEKMWTMLDPATPINCLFHGLLVALLDTRH